MSAVRIHLSLNLAFNGVADMGGYFIYLFFLQLPMTFNSIRSGQEVGTLNIKS